MEGGIRAWRGMVAKGGPDAGMAMFAAAERVEEMVALAWSLENGTRFFYQEIMALLTEDHKTRQIFSGLIQAEESHMRQLRTIYRQHARDQASIEEALTDLGRSRGEVMEGGVVVREALAWAREQQPPEVLELAMELEVNSYDFYIKMSRRMEGVEERVIFKNLAEEEQNHLELLSSLLDDYLRA